MVSDHTTKRRDVLKMMAISTSTITGGTGAVSAGDTVISTNDEIVGLKNKYQPMDDSKVKNLFTTYASDVIRLLSEPIANVEGLTNELPDNMNTHGDYNEVSLLNGSKLSEFEESVPGISFNVTDGTATANLVLTKKLPNGKLTIAAEPEANRSYAILKLADEEGGTSTVVINPKIDQVTTSACINDYACQPDCWYPCDQCVRKCACRTHEITCCQDYCYWGGDTSSLCNCPACEHCEYHCGFWSSY